MKIPSAAALAAACLLPTLAWAGAESGSTDTATERPATTTSKRAQPAKKASQSQRTPPPPLADPYRMPSQQPASQPHHAGPDPLDATHR